MNTRTSSIKELHNYCLNKNKAVKVKNTQEGAFVSALFSDFFV